MNKDLKVGDKVELSIDHEHEDCIYNNPIETEGEVVSVSDNDVVYVNWPYGSNAYNHNDSDLIKVDV